MKKWSGSTSGRPAVVEEPLWVFAAGDTSVTESQNPVKKWHIDFGYGFRLHRGANQGLGAENRACQEVSLKRYVYWHWS